MRNRLLAATAATVTAVGLALPAASATAQSTTATYRNPVSAGFADTFADPSVIRAKDGAWYAYATSDPLRSGDTTRPNIPTARSTDLVHWSYAGEVFNSGNWPSWVASDSSFWAPDIRYLDGRYVVYYVATDALVNGSPSGGSAIGVATAPSPTGPWTDSGAPLVGPRPSGNGDYLWTFDPALLTAVGGQRYLYYGSYYGGVYGVPLTPDGMHTAGTATRVAIDNRYEGAYVVEHAGWYYLFVSAGNCCAGPTTGYSVFAGRSRQPLGPFRDKHGVSLNTSRVGGTPVIAPNGNTWIGTGHNAMVTDLAGQTWLAYHAIDRHNPYLDQPYGINRRPMLLDRLDWIGGWPTVRAGRWASDTPQPAPVTTGLVDETFATGIPATWSSPNGRWRAAGSGTGGYARETAPGGGTLLTDATVPRDVRVEADVRTATQANVGIMLRRQDAANRVEVLVEPRYHALMVESVSAGRIVRTSVPLPADVVPTDWHNLAVELRGQRLSATLTDARLGDPYATVSATLPAGLTAGATGVVTRGGTGDVDNVTVASLYTPVTSAVPVPQPGQLLSAYSDDFSGGLDPAWHWVRRDPAAHVANGALVWPTENADLVGTANNAGVLLRAAPTGDYIVEVKLHLDLGVDTVRNYEQAGLIAYDNDDLFARLCSVAIWDTRQVEFGKEMPYAGSLSYGGNLGGPPAPTMLLRLAQHTDPATGEHLFRQGSSTDGQHWTWGGTWTLPAGTSPQIGLVSMGGNQPPATASFDYVHVYRW